MPRNLRPGSIAPPGLVVDHVEAGAGLTLIARPIAASARCPNCGQPSSRMHSRYTRMLSDLPVAGRSVVLAVTVRRFRCDGAGCRTKIFAERLGPDLASAYARRTGRLECIVHHLGLALGGRPAPSFAGRLMVPAIRDTLLRSVRRRAQGPAAQGPAEPLTVIGIDDTVSGRSLPDTVSRARAALERSRNPHCEAINRISYDWAFRRGQRYGSLACDLERRRVVALLPDRESGTVEAWLKAHPGIAVVARDRGGGYGEAATRALPEAIQVADRWHLMENASAAFLDAVRKSMAAIRTAVDAATVDPERLTCAERLQHEGYLRRQETDEAILTLSRQGMPIKQIARTTDHSRTLVRNVVRGLTGDVFRVRQSSLEATCLGSTRRGRPAAATAPNSGGDFARRGSPAACGWSGNGSRAVGAASRLPRGGPARCPRRASWRG